MSDLLLLFRIGESRFAMNTSEIVEVLPALVWTAVPQSPPGVAGMFGYRGQSVPLIDLSEWTTGRRAEVHMSTRIVLVRDSGRDRLLGLIVEHATETLRAAENDFCDSGIAVAAPYLGRVAHFGPHTIQRFDVRRFLKTDLVERLLADGNGD